MIHWELCKKWNLTILQNEIPKIRLDFEMQTDHIFPARRPEQLIIYKKKTTCQIVDFAVKIKENEKRDQYLDLARELKKGMEHENDGDNYCNCCAWNGPQRMGKGIGRLGNWRTNRDHPDDSIVKIGQNTEKSPGDLR